MSLSATMQRAYAVFYIVGLVTAAASVLSVPLVWLGLVGTWLRWQPIAIGLALILPAVLFRIARPRFGLLWPGVIRRSTHERTSFVLFGAMLVLLLLGAAAYRDAPIRPEGNFAVGKYGAHYGPLHAERFALWESSYFLVGGAVLIMTVIGTPDRGSERV
jgi:hypothetical protein